MISVKSSKVALSIILILTFSIAASGQKSESKEKLKSITVYEEKFDALVSKKLIESEVYYDARGNVIEEKNYKDGRITKHFKYQFDDSDNKTREEEYDPAGKLLEYSEYKNENGRRVEKTVYDKNNKIKSRKTYQYTTF